MPLTLPGHEPGLSGGLSSWLGRLVTFVNGLEVEVRGRPSLEQQLAGRQDAVAQQLRQQIGAERTVQQQVAAGLRGQLDEETRARIEASQQIADVRDRLKALDDRIDALVAGEVTQEEHDALAARVRTIRGEVDDLEDALNAVSSRVTTNEASIALRQTASQVDAAITTAVPLDRRIPTYGSAQARYFLRVNAAGDGVEFDRAGTTITPTPDSTYPIRVRTGPVASIVMTGVGSDVNPPVRVPGVGVLSGVTAVYPSTGRVRVSITGFRVSQYPSDKPVPRARFRLDIGGRSNYINTTSTTAGAHTVTVPTWAGALPVANPLVEASYPGGETFRLGDTVTVEIGTITVERF